MVVIKLLCLRCLLILVLDSIEAETVNSTTEVVTVTANAGETIVLLCPKSQNLTITFWIGPDGDNYNILGSTDIIVSNSRLEINETNAALIIHNVTMDDRGNYTCSATQAGQAIVQLVVTNNSIEAETDNSTTEVVTVTANAGETTVLLCPKSQDLTITFWIGLEGKSYNFPGSTDIRVSNTRLAINETNAALIIHDVTMGDQGNYTCFATHIGEAILQLVVTNIPPAQTEVHNTQVRGNRTVVHGSEDQSLMLVCKANGGKPAPMVTWLRKDTNETFSSNVTEKYENGTYAVSSSLQLLANRSLDGVVVTCRVSHPALDSPTEIDIEIYLDLKPLFEKTEEETITTEGFNTSLRCTVFGARPEPNVTLTFDGETMTNFDFNQNKTVYNESTETYSTTLEFYKIMDRHDNGKTVSCGVHHVTFESPISRTWAVNVHYPPSVSVTSTNTTAVSELLSLECLASNGNPDNYTFKPWQHTWPSYSNILREISSTIVDLNKATLELRNLTFQDSGYYKCFASNGVGSPDSPVVVAEKKIYVVVEDTPFVVDGHAEYLSSTDEEIEIMIEVYTVVEPIHVSIERNSDTVGRTAVWNIGDKIQKTVELSVYNHKILKSGYRIPIMFDVQAEKNYGAYRIGIRNDIGTTYHNFSILPKEVRSTPSPAPQDESKTNVAAIVVGTVVPLVVLAIILIAAVIYCKSKQQSRNNAARVRTVSKKFVKRHGENEEHYDYIYPTGEGGPKDDGYLNPDGSRFRAKYVEYTKGDEKLVIKTIEGAAPPGMDQVDMAGSMKLPSLTMMSESNDPSASGYVDLDVSTQMPSLTITELPDEEATDVRYTNECSKQVTDTKQCSEQVKDTDQCSQHERAEPENEYITGI